MNGFPIYPKELWRDAVDSSMTAMPNPNTMNGCDGPRTKPGFVANAVRRFFDGQSGDSRSHNGFEKIGAFFNQHRLSATPRNYDIAYRYLVTEEPRIIDAINELLTSRAGVSDQTVAELYAHGQPVVTAEMLTQFVTRAQSYISKTAEIIDQSHMSVKSFGDNLELVELPKGLASQIVDLTKSMIVKSRRFEFKLKKMDSEIGELRSRLDVARKDAMQDPLTGLPNRRAFLEKLNDAIANVEKNEHPLCVAYCDIDHFKAINDTYGHDVGDRVIQFIGKRIEEIATSSMSVARYGGEEFVILFENCTLTDAVDQMDALRIDIGERRLVRRESGEPLDKITFSAGVAALQGSIDGPGLLKAADQALYRAKELGRNRVETLMSQPR
jgi:diguanylate cyclase